MDHYYSGGSDLPLDALIPHTRVKRILGRISKTAAEDEQLKHLQPLDTPYGPLYRLSDVLEVAAEHATLSRVASNRKTDQR